MRFWLIFNCRLQEIAFRLLKNEADKLQQAQELQQDWEAQYYQSELLEDNVSETMHC